MTFLSKGEPGIRPLVQGRDPYFEEPNESRYGFLGDEGLMIIVTLPVSPSV